MKHLLHQSYITNLFNASNICIFGENNFAMGKINSEKLSQMVKQKRGNTGLRKTADTIGISAPTLSRIEQGRVPDLDTYLLLCEWLEVSTEYFILNNSHGESSKKKIIAHLRADKELDANVSDAIIKMIDFAYKNIK